MGARNRRPVPAFVQLVGLFVDADTLTICDVQRQVHLSAVQLNGHESPEVVARLQPIPVIKSIPVDRVRLSDHLQLWKNAIAQLKLTNLAGLVMETPATGVPGGSGVANDFAALAEAQKRAILPACRPSSSPAACAAKRRRSSETAPTVCGGCQQRRGGIGERPEIPGENRRVYQSGDGGGESGKCDFVGSASACRLFLRRAARRTSATIPSDHGLFFHNSQEQFLEGIKRLELFVSRTFKDNLEPPVLAVKHKIGGFVIARNKHTATLAI